MVKKIALEEHFLCPGFEAYWQPTVGDVDPAIYAQVVARLSDFGELRLAAMDQAGIARSGVAVPRRRGEGRGGRRLAAVAQGGIARSVRPPAGPGVQAERDVAPARRNARAANDALAREI